MITFKRPSFFSCLLLFPTDRQIRFLSCRRWRNFGQHKVGSGKPLASADLNFVEKKNIASYGHHSALFNYFNDREMKRKSGGNKRNGLEGWQTREDSAIAKRDFRRRRNRKWPHRVSPSNPECRPMTSNGPTQSVYCTCYPSFSSLLVL